MACFRKFLKAHYKKNGRSVLSLFRFRVISFGIGGAHQLDSDVDFSIKLKYIMMYFFDRLANIAEDASINHILLLI